MVKEVRRAANMTCTDGSAWDDAVDWFGIRVDLPICLHYREM